MTLFEHVPHPHIAARHQQSPVKVADQLPATADGKPTLNARIALALTRGVGTMWCAYAFGVFDLLALPEALKGGVYGIVQWTASFFLQLVLLSVIMVGQNIQSGAADARAEATFKDAEAVLHEAEQIQQHLAAQDELNERVYDLIAALHKALGDTRLRQGTDLRRDH
jgi:hypothetical protein